MNYYGKYRGIVEDVSDPENRGRIRAKCPEVLGEQLSRWALPCFPPNTFTIPHKGALIWIEFEGGNRDKPIWTGVFYTKEQYAGKFGAPYSPDKYIIKSVGEFVEINSNKGITRVGNLKTLDVQLNGNLESTGNLTSTGDLVLNGNLVSTGNLASTGDLVLKGDLILTGDIINLDETVQTP